MSGIVLSASVRQNLLSLQSTADLLSTTQNRLATGNKVNSALDNPTNFFTAQGLNNRASDINNLLDSIGNGVQVLQAANTGITSLQKLVDTAKSIANQALQTPSGYSQKSSVTTAAIAGATADDLRGAPVGGSAATSGSLTAGAFSAVDVSGTKTMTFTVTVDGGTAQNVSLDATTVSNYNTAHSTSLNAASLGAQDVADLVNSQITGATVSVSAGNLKFTSSSTGTSSNVATSAVTATNTPGGSTGITSATGTAGAAAIAGTSPLDTLTLTIGATGGGTATTITFGNGTGGTVKSLNQLNDQLAANNLMATLSSDGKITISTTNDAASATMGTIGGTAAGAGKAFAGLTGGAPTQDPNSLATRASLVAQYNTIIDQIKTTAQDSSFNGVNLLNGDQLKLVFNETGKSTLTIQGVTFDPAGLGLAKLTSGTDFIDNASTNKVLDTLSNASSSLRSQASAFGSNLSVVQIRQDFNKNLINVLQTGSSNLTLADTNEEAANSQALSTRQSIAVSALALANQSQQSVLQLLR
jgi:flagellin-like hook-associated protein FlgL